MSDLAAILLVVGAITVAAQALAVAFLLIRDERAAVRLERIRWNEERAEQAREHRADTRELITRAVHPQVIPQVVRPTSPVAPLRPRPSRPGRVMAPAAEPVAEDDVGDGIP